jgi:pyruvate formate lyase activating enzyme
MSSGDEHILHRGRCVLSGECATVCPSKALELAGEDLSVDRVIDTVLRDRLYYETSGGGMTLSGGEPLLQIDFTDALLQEAKTKGVHTAIETCGQVGFNIFERIMPHTDLFLYDLKETDNKHHIQYTGVGNERILANLRKLCESDAAVLLRLPIVPGFNDRHDHFESVAKLAGELPGLLGVEVMPYHSLGTSKRQRFGLESEGACEPQPPTSETVSRWITALRDLGVKIVNGE